MAMAAHTVVSIDAYAHTVLSIDQYLHVHVGVHVAVFVDVITYVIVHAFLVIHAFVVTHADLDSTLGSIQGLTGSWRYTGARRMFLFKVACRPWQPLQAL